MGDLAKLKHAPPVTLAEVTQQERTHQFRLIHAADLEARAPEWIIRGLIETDSLAMIFGDPACGKSFLAVDWACSVATGKEYHGHTVQQAPVIFIAGEGLNGIARRLQAWGIRYGADLSLAPLYVSSGPADLIDDLAVLEVTHAVDAIVEAQGAPAMVIVDTVARNFGPGDENSTQDMTKFIAAADTIRTRYRCSVLLVHHTGHGDKTRARGAMALKGALDAEYRLEKGEDGVTRLEATKMKDAELPEPMAFKLRSVELALLDDEGKAVTSAVLDPVEYEPPARRTSSGMGKWQMVALESLQELYTRNRSNREQGGYDPSGARITIEQWREACYEREMSRQRFNEARESLVRRNAIRIENIHVYLSEL